MQQVVTSSTARPSARLRIVQRDTPGGQRLTGVLRPRERITAARLVTWAYRDQKADVMTGKGLHGLEAGVDGYEAGAFSGAGSCCSTIEMNGLLGTVIRSTAWQQRPSLHPDAEAVHDAVLGMNWPVAKLLMLHGRTASEPDWAARQQLEPIIQKGGQVVDHVIAEVVPVRYKNREVRNVEVCYCPLAPYPSDEGVAAMRGVYRMWHEGLCELASRLSQMRLVRWAVDGVGAPAEPWPDMGAPARAGAG